MPTYVLTIDGTDWPIKPRTISISETANGRNSLTCQIDSLDGSLPTMFADVSLTEDATRIFGGTLRKRSYRGFGGGTTSAAVTISLEVPDFNERAERRYFRGRLPAGTLKSWLQVLVDYIPGATLDPAQVNGPALPDSPFFDWQRIDEVLNQVMALVGAADGNKTWIWENDYDEIFRAFEPGTVAAPFDIVSGSTSEAIGDITVDEDAASSYNRIILRFNAAAIAAYAFFGVGANFADGDEVTIGSQTYTFQSVLTDVARHVALGGTRSDSMNNLIAAITHGAGSGTAYAASTSANTQVTAGLRSADTILVQAIEAGASGNSIGVSTTAAHASWFTEGNIATSTLTLGADEALTNNVTAEDPSAATDPRELVLSIASVLTYETAQALANGELVRRLPVPATANYLTTSSGVHPGQTQGITASQRGLGSSFLVSAVRIVDDGRGALSRRVTAGAGLQLQPGGVRDTLKAMSGGGSTPSVLGGVITVVSGGPAPVGFVIRFPLGGSRDESRVTGAGVFLPVHYANRFNAPATFDGRVRCDIWARHPAVTITARLHDETAGVDYDLTPVTGVTITQRTLDLTIVDGHNYVLFLSSDTANEGGFVIGTLESR